jgi:hypothetical protein
MDWVPLAQDSDQGRIHVNVDMNFQAAYNSGNFSSSFGIIHLPRRTQRHEVS